MPRPNPVLCCSNDFAFLLAAIESTKQPTKTIAVTTIIVS
jgi:hypothetical protein